MQLLQVNTSKQAHEEDVRNEGREEEEIKDGLNEGKESAFLISSWNGKEEEEEEVKEEES